MTQRLDLLTLVTEIRGRLDELETCLRTGEPFPVPAPRSFENRDIVDITPASYLEFRADGLGTPIETAPYRRHVPFFWFGAPDKATQCSLRSFELSELHRAGPEPAFGLEISPNGPAPEWMTYEFICDNIDLSDFEWVEWILKIAVSEPTILNMRFYVDAEGADREQDLPAVHASEFATFQHLRMSCEGIMKGRRSDRHEARLAIAPDGKALKLFNLSLRGKLKRGEA